MIYYGVPRMQCLEEWVSLDVPFEYQDFMLPDVLDCPEETDRLVKGYTSTGRELGEDILHGPFLDIAVHSSDKRIRAVSDCRIRQVCDIAVRLQAKAVVLHTNIIPNFYLPSYRQSWLDRNEAYITELLADYPSLWVYMENMFDNEPDALAALAQRMSGQRFGVCLDIAHANISGTALSRWIEVCRPYVAHYHLNDNHGVIDEHLPIGEGNVPWGDLLPLLGDSASRLIEVDSLDKYKQSRAWLDADSK